MYKKDDGVLCIYEETDIQLNLQVTCKLITDEVDIWILSEYIINYTVPLRFVNAQLSAIELEQLKDMAKEYGLKVNEINNYIEITK